MLIIKIIEYIVTKETKIIIIIYIIVIKEI